MKIIIAGGRDFDDYEHLRACCDYYIQHDPNTEIVSGGARGTDRLGEKYADFEGFKLTIFKADWDSFGKSAGHIRNKEMAIYADALIAFWDGKSKGTKGMIDQARKYDLNIRIVDYRK